MKRSTVLWVALAAAAVVALFAFWPRQPAPAPRWHAKKVILITIDALRRDRLGCYGYKERKTTPALDAWCPRAVVFDYAVAPAPWTIPSLGALFTGHYPIEIGAYTNQGGISPDFATLPELFQRQGFVTASFNTHALLVLDEPGFRRGFDSVSPEQVQPQEEGEHKMPFVKVEPLLMDWLDQHANDDRFFVWVHDMDTHQPPTVGNPYLDDPDWSEYDAEVHWVDAAFGRILVKLQALGIWDDALIIFSADHGEAFDEHGILGHQNVMYDEVLRIPLLLRYPTMGAPKRIDEPVDHLDLFSTIVELAGLDLPNGTKGESLVPLIEGERRFKKRPFLYESRYHYEGGYHELAVRDRWWKVLATVKDLATGPRDERLAPTFDMFATNTRLELYHRLFDPTEETDLYDTYPNLVEQFQHALAEWQRAATPPRRMAPELDEAGKEALRALGYGDADEEK
jgi:arylsulfatase A-like enzyme